MTGRLSALLPLESDRAAFIGQTGCGKTTLAEYICRSRPYVVVLDSKGTLRWRGYRIYTTLAGLMQSTHPRLIYRPVYDELQDPDTINAFFEWIYQRRHTTVYVDELYGIAQRDTFPYYYGACLTRGRELGIEVFTATQRPSLIPGVVLSESEHIYQFKLKLPRDRDKAAELTGLDPQDIQGLAKRRFFYVRQDAEPVGPLTLSLPTA